MVSPAHLFVMETSGHLQMVLGRGAMGLGAPQWWATSEHCQGCQCLVHSTVLSLSFLCEEAFYASS